ncbi:MAG: hypothetical protein U0556_10460 [Dehalococcoidia bacterium]
MIHMAHHGDNRWPLLKAGRIILEQRLGWAGCRLFLLFRRFDDVKAHVERDRRRRVVIEHRVQAGHGAVLHQLLDDVDAGDPKQVGKFGN